MIKLVVGLGNPGSEYDDTRHNFGFAVLDALLSAKGSCFTKNRFHGLSSTVSGIHFLKPSTYMNSSGLAVAAASNFYKIKPHEIVVFHDELDISLGRLRYKLGGGDAGHKGLISITSSLGSSDFHRVRLGISRPSVIPVADYVLQKFSAEERELVRQVIGVILGSWPHLLAGDWNKFSQYITKI